MGFSLSGTNSQQAPVAKDFCTMLFCLVLSDLWGFCEVTPKRRVNKRERRKKQEAEYISRECLFVSGSDWAVSSNAWFNKSLWSYCVNYTSFTLRVGSPASKHHRLTSLLNSKDTKLKLLWFCIMGSKVFSQCFMKNLAVYIREWEHTKEKMQWGKWKHFKMRNNK